MGLFKLLQVFLVSCCLKGCVLCICSTTYGAKPCPYVPSPPGETPPCARPGMTYCEYPTHYPRELVQHLLETWKYDHATLLLDESRYDLSNYFITSDTKYGVNTYGPPQNNIHNDYYPDNNNNNNNNNNYGGSSFQGYPSNTYIPAPRNNTYNQYRPNYPSNQIHSYKHGNKVPYAHSSFQRYNHPPYFKSIGVPEVIPQNANTWPKWGGRSDKYYMRRKRDLHRMRRWTENNNATKGEERSKRQTNAGQTLCQSRSNYIMPRAALNNQGNWMYVVNVPEVDNRFTQLVKSETCVSQQCSGLCGLPNGYTSRCEQKYVQKRLVAVESGGNQLYSDVFWFPSCCICTINNN